MILDYEVEIKLNSCTVDYYKLLGYEIPIKKASESTKKRTHKEFVYDFSKPIKVKISDLQKGSNQKILVLCDFCKKTKKYISYNDYNKITEKDGLYCCKECTHNKIVETNLQKYGVKNYSQTDEFKKKRREKCLEKYNTEDYFQTDEFKEKKRRYNIEKYGVDHYAKTTECQEKRKQTFKKMYGVTNPMQLKENKKKAMQTFINKYGYPNPSQSPEIKEKILNTNLQKYGVPWTMQNSEVRKRANETLCKNGTQKTSLQQLFLHSLYGGELNYPISYYAIDICFPNERLCIEYDGGGHFLRVDLGVLTQEEFNQKEIIRNNVIKHEGYKQMRIISSTDKLPSDEILLQMLDYTRKYFSDYPNRSWIEFNVDSSIVRNAEQKEGSYFNFGELRRIKKSDVETINSSESNCA